jgi:hypothetical protein
MRSKSAWTFLLGLTITASSFAVMADEQDEIRKKSYALLQEAAELSKQGRKFEAAQLELRARDLLEKSEQLEARRHPDIQHLKERLVDLMAALQKAKESGAEQEAREIGVQIYQTERKLNQLASQPGERVELKDVPEQFRPQAEKLAMASRRLSHVRVAAENLQAAEMHDMAHELMKKAEAMAQDVSTAKMELKRAIEAASHERGSESKGEVSELRSENERLRRELKELREVVQRLQIKLESESAVDSAGFPPK